ncbi:MAG: sugar ABC transporter permease [Clostridiales bacterium]|jgi:multiple sugar transport system permease protein|nr:sugar ABC transporter permease [Clostridiales bacterium]
MRHKSVSYAKYGYIFLVPFVAAFLFFSLYPIIYTLVISMSDLKGVGTASFSILANPFQNFINIAKNELFQKSLATTGIIWILNFIPQMALALLLTAWFTNERLRVRGQGAFKVLLYMPNIITSGTIAVLFYSLFSYPIGPVNSLVTMLGLTDRPYEFLRDASVARGLIAFIQFWMWYGNTMIVLIAGVLGISPAIFDAAAIDGANSLKTFLYVTLPSLRQIMLYTLITSLIGGLQMFDIPKLFTNGGPDNATQTASVYIFNQAFTGSYQYNRAAAASMLMFVITAIFSGALFYLMRDKDAQKAKKQRKLLEKAAALNGGAQA